MRQEAKEQSVTNKRGLNSLTPARNSIKGMDETRGQSAYTYKQNRIIEQMRQISTCEHGSNTHLRASISVPRIGRRRRQPTSCLQIFVILQTLRFSSSWLCAVTFALSPSDPHVPYTHKRSCTWDSSRDKNPPRMVTRSYREKTPTHTRTQVCMHACYHVCMHAGMYAFVYVITPRKHLWYHTSQAYMMMNVCL